MAWNTYVIQSTWRGYKRGGRWIQPHLWQACRAREQQNWGAGADWRGDGAYTKRHWQQPSNKCGQPKTTRQHPAPKPDSKMAVQPQSSTRKAEAAEVLSKALAILESKGLPHQDILMFGQTLSPLFEPPVTSPQEQLADDRLWASRLHKAHRSLSYWQRELDKRREEQRVANRRYDSAAKHLEHFRRKMQAAQDKTPQWEQFTAFEDVDKDYDSQADDQENEEQLDEEDMSTTGDLSTDLSDLSTPKEKVPAGTVKAMMQLLNEKGLSEQDVQGRREQNRL